MERQAVDYTQSCYPYAAFLRRFKSLAMARSVSFTSSAVGNSAATFGVDNIISDVSLTMAVLQKIAIWETPILRNYEMLIQHRTH